MDNITNSPWGPEYLKPLKNSNNPPISENASKVNDAVAESLSPSPVFDKGKTRSVAKTEKDDTKGIASKKLEPPKISPKPNLTPAQRVELGISPNLDETLENWGASRAAWREA